MQAFVGMTVQWFVRANKSAPPLPAVVTVVHPGGMLSMSVCDENSVWSTRRSVWQLGSAQLRNNAKLGEKAGAWDFAKPPVVSEQKTPAPAPVSEIPPQVPPVPPSDDLSTREGKEVAAKKALQKATTPSA